MTMPSTIEPKSSPLTTLTNSPISTPQALDANELEYKLLPDVRKGKSDWREYRAIQLKNGVTCVLVHDKESKYTAMATAVDAGASYDPRSYSGLAHFTEHMCFLGSEKYPGENEYKRYLSSHGGHSNASTAMGHTTYKFDVLAEHAEKAIDIFSNFFIEPLFTQSGTNREVNAVDSENSKNLISDLRRRLQVLKAVASPDHHYSKFSTGNAITLPAAIDNNTESKEKQLSASKVREALLAFHKYHYRPENMTVVCIGPQSLDTLEKWVVPRYSAVKKRWKETDEKDMTDIEKLITNAASDAPRNHFRSPPPPYNPAFSSDVQGGKWPVLLTTLPLKSVRRLVLLFPLPPIRYKPDRSPFKILSHLLGHEGKGSVFALLQDAGLLTSLSTGARISAPDQCVFQISINLTEIGESQWKDVVECVFRYCHLIYQTTRLALKEREEMKKLSDVQKKIIGEMNDDVAPNICKLLIAWNEIISLSKMQFDQTSPGSAYNLAPGLANSILMFGTEKCMSAGFMLDENMKTLPLDELLEFASLLTPRNCLLERCSQMAWEEAKSKEYQNDNLFGFKKEKWYGVEYCLSDIDEIDVSAWTSLEENSDKDGIKNDKSDEAIVEVSKFGQLFLPKVNQFIPRNLDLCPDLPLEAHSPRIEKEIDPPNLVVEDNKFGRLWHRLDDRYALPKASLTLFMRNASVQHTLNKEGIWVHDIEASTRSSLLMSVFSDSLAQETYDASLAGLHWSLSETSSGISLSCGGYSDRLPDFATKLLRDFFHPENQVQVGGPDNFSFLNESIFNAAKDRTIRNLKSFFHSRRADSLALYYTSTLLSGRNKDINHSISVAESITFESLIDHHKKIIRHPGANFECLISGNISEKQAKDFFADSKDIFYKAVNENKDYESGDRNQNHQAWIPGPFQRKLKTGENVELHFQSENLEEENGAVVISFQSPIPGYKGVLSPFPESLRTSAALRLICHMLREPLFDELRTKQQLGYIVHSYYDKNFCIEMQDGNSSEFEKGLITPIDYVTINILSRKFSPLEVATRIDDFLDSFRKSLVAMPTSEIKDHSDSLSKQLLKPIQKLGTEASIHYGKILRFGPECLDSINERQDIPWDLTKNLAASIKSLTREELLQTYDIVVVGKQRSRIVSHVYGKTFPMNDVNELQTMKSKTRDVISGNITKIFEKRKELTSYSSFARNYAQRRYSLADKLFNKINTTSRNKKLAVLAVGVGAVGLGLHFFKRKQESRGTEATYLPDLLNPLGKKKEKIQ